MTVIKARLSGTLLLFVATGLSLVTLASGEYGVVLVIVTAMSLIALCIIGLAPTGRALDRRKALSRLYDFALIVWIFVLLLDVARRSHF